MLNSLSISARIYGGFAIVVALLAGLALYTFESLLDVEHTFDNFAEADHHTEIVSDAVERLAAARIARLNYQIDRSEAARKTTEAAIGEVIAASAQSATVFVDPDEADIQRRFAAVGPIAQEYRNGFARQVEAAARGDALRKSFQEHGFELYGAIEEVIALARAENENELAHWASELGLQFFRSRMRATLFMFTADPAELDGATARIAKMHEAYDRMTRAAVMQPRAQEIGGRIRTMIDRFEAELDEARALIGAQAEIERTLQHEIGPRLSEAMRETLAAIDAMQAEYKSRTDAKIDQVRGLAAIVGAGAVAVGAALAWMIGRWIARAVGGMAAAMTRMAEGDLDAEIAGTEHRHELGAMARALQAFQRNGREKRRLDAEAEAARARDAAAAAERAALQAAVAQVVDSAAAGDFARRVDPRYADDALNEFARQLNALLDTVREGVGETSRVMASLARGDLAARMNGAYRGTFAELKDNVNATVARLRDTVSEIMTVSDAMRERTGAIAESAETLSGRAENQAASLEEVAATMEEMSATVRTNAENAMSARDLSAEAHTRADKGGEVVRKAVAAMGEIAAGSGKIADIVSVIDGFAFQTNLLALNAAVEAARAGEAGKGFAVVASEVRMLAQRSAEAARDIKTLIEESARQVEGGVKLVEETGAALTEIVEAIARVSDTITEISEASREQSSGVEEITTAITSLDEITQQNSAMADQSAAAAKALAEQARTLERLVSFFSLGAGGAGGAARSAAA